MSIDESRVRLSGSGVEVIAEHRGISAALAEAVRGLAGARARLTTRHQQAAVAITPGYPPTPQAVGLLLAESFLPAPVADELARVIADAESRWEPVRLGVVVDGSGAACPGRRSLSRVLGPLALHPLVTVYRWQEAPPVPVAPGPLRILIAISAPLAGGGQVLDYERELWNVIAALRQEPVHVLHLSGHGAPGLLGLEDENGNARPVTADQFVTEAVPPGRMPPVAACHTDRDRRTSASSALARWASGRC